MTELLNVTIVLGIMNFINKSFFFFRVIFIPGVETSFPLALVWSE